MRIVRTEISLQFNNPVSVIERNDQYFRSPFHYHPEIELVYIAEGSGKRIIGDKIESFSKGEVVLIGSNVPHVWMTDENPIRSNPRSIVAYFNRDIFGKAFYELKEAENITRLLEAASRGLLITGEQRATVAERMEHLLNKEGFERIIYLLEILHAITLSKDISFINSKSYSGCSQKTESDRLATVFKYVSTNFSKNIGLKDVAAVSNLTPQSFCRFFKNRVNKHFVDYLHEVRISHACRCLLETDQSIAEVAYNSGFNTVPNFNKQFKLITGLCPTEYRSTAPVTA